MDDSLSPDEESIKKRREKLIRRPSYRKILNDIARAELGCEYDYFLFEKNIQLISNHNDVRNATNVRFIRC